jgi:hypothetical protein
MHAAPIGRALALIALFTGAPAGATEEAALAELERAGATVTRGLGARALLDRFGGAFGIDGRADIRTLRAGGRDAVGMEHVRLQQQRDEVQVAKLATAVCWEAAFAAGDLVVNDAGLLKAKAKN